MIPRANWFYTQPPSSIHGIGHTARVMVWASVLSDGTAWHDAVLWAAACHDLRRHGDGPDPDHGTRAGAWVRGVLPGLLRHPLPQLEAIATACAHYATPDARSRWRTPVVDVLHDADHLDGVRVGEIDARLLRSDAARARMADAMQLLQTTVDCTTVREIIAVAAQQGLPVTALRQWLTFWSGTALEEVIDPRGDGPPATWYNEAALRETTWFRGLAGSRFRYDSTPWPSPAPMLVLADAAASLTPEAIAEIRAADWFAHVHAGNVVCAPARAVPMPAELFHAGALDLPHRGLLRVCLTATEAGAGATRIDTRDLDGRLYRDPASPTGFLLDAEAIPAGCVQVVKRVDQSNVNP